MVYAHTREEQRSLSTVLNSASNGHPTPYEVEIRKKPKLDKGTENKYLIMNQQSKNLVATTNTTTGPTCTYNFNFTSSSSVTVNNFKAPN